jgi:leucyl aminopeptidase
VASFYLVRDLINTPTEDMGPAELAEAVTQVGDECGAAVFQVIGDDLLNQNFPLIHAVGRGAASQPRLVELNWGEETHPKLTLVGKGVCYDSGGYSLKPSKSMSGMKKDMGGAAHALGLAYLIMQAKLPVRLRLLIPMVENMVSDRSYRPGDVFVARNGLSVEVGNTDAEGRLILADALAYAAEDDPELLLDFATLTGAARVAMGPDVTPVMATNQAICDAVLAAAREVQDPMCQMPLYEPYKRFIQSPIADVANLNTKAVGQAGAITAGLFLQHFVADCDWLHFDLYGWHDDSLPGRPMGPGIMAIRAVWQYFQQKYTA